jgi:hypothetical protein
VVEMLGETIRGLKDLPVPDEAPGASYVTLEKRQLLKERRVGNVSDFL